MKKFIDSHDRVVSYLRISVTDRCDFRCVYCMSEDMVFLPRKDLISLEETARIAKIFADYGANKFRLTGGEPLVRKNIQWLVNEISGYSGIEQIGITTNGSMLNKLAKELKSAGVTRLNISLDTLNAANFKSITRTGDLATVLAGIDESIAKGLTNIRLNTVIMRGNNEDQIIPLIDFAREKEIDIAFIEEMPMGDVSHNRKDTYISSSDIKNIISQSYPLIENNFASAGPAKYFSFSDSKSKVGFISPHSCNFCSDCNRVRLTVEGRLLLCLGQENSLDLRGLLRSGKSDTEIASEIQKALQKKPKGHDFDLNNEKPLIFRHMSHTGGYF